MLRTPIYEVDAGFSAIPASLYTKFHRIVDGWLTSMIYKHPERDQDFLEPGRN